MFTFFHQGQVQAIITGVKAEEHKHKKIHDGIQADFRKTVLGLQLLSFYID